MPFDPSKPANGSLISSAELRAQFTGLQSDLVNAIAAQIAGTSANSNSVGTLGQTADGSYSQSQMQDVMNKLDELINALRR